MPNWCDNVMTISHSDPAMLEKAEAAWNSGGFLGFFIPCPQELIDTRAGSYGAGTPEQLNLEAQIKHNISAYGFANWYDWRVANWGTKWDIGLDSDLDNRAKIDNGSFTVSFCSAWSPPEAAYEKLEMMGFEIKAYYYEPGMGFCGEYTPDSIDSYSTSDPPEHLDEMFGISETNKNFEE